MLKHGGHIILKTFSLSRRATVATVSQHRDSFAMHRVDACCDYVGAAWNAQALLARDAGSGAGGALGPARPAGRRAGAAGLCF